METLEGQLARLEKEQRAIPARSKRYVGPMNAQDWYRVSLEERIAELKERIERQHCLEVDPFFIETRRMVWAKVEDPWVREYMVRLECIARAAQEYWKMTESVQWDEDIMAADRELADALAMVPGLVQEA